MIERERTIEPGGDERMHVASEAAQDDARASDVVVMHGPVRETEDEVKDVSAEGRPGDARMGPGGLKMLMMAGVIAVIVTAIAIGAWLGWAAGAVAMSLGLLGMMLNPAMLAAQHRRKDRETVLHRRAGHPDREE